MTTATAERTRVAISLETACVDARCSKMAFGLHHQLSAGQYAWPMSVIDIDEPAGAYLASLRTARRRAETARANGYRFREFDRSQHNHELHAVNTSLAERQGRPMSVGYLEPPNFMPLGEQCDRHRVTAYGVFDREGVLVAYSFIYRSGRLALVSQILGHGDHLTRYVMFLLMVETVCVEMRAGGFMVYNRHDSGTDGLRQFKEWHRFAPMEVEWLH